MMNEKPRLRTQKKRVLVTVFAVVFAAAVSIYLAMPDDADRRQYQELSAESGKESMATQADKHKSPPAAKQHRSGVLKEIVIHDAPHRRLATLGSEKSLLLFGYGSSSTAIVEKMEGVACVIQEELFYRASDGRELAGQKGEQWLLRGLDPEKQESWIVLGEQQQVEPCQLILFIEADQGLYDYSSADLILQNVRLFRYDIKTHTLPAAKPLTQPVMAAEAKDASLAFVDRQLQFTAKHLKARFSNGGQGR